MPYNKRWMEETSRLIRERGDWIRTATQLSDTELRWLNKHLDYAFEGRHDHLRTDTPQWLRQGSILL